MTNQPGASPHSRRDKMTAQAAYETQRDAAIAQARALIASLEAPVESPHWGHVGSLEKVNADLAETSRFWRV